MTTYDSNRGSAQNYDSNRVVKTTIRTTHPDGSTSTRVSGAGNGGFVANSDIDRETGDGGWDFIEGHDVGKLWVGLTGVGDVFDSAIGGRGRSETGSAGKVSLGGKG
jgi:hypothetical protein